MTIICLSLKEEIKREPFSIIQIVLVRKSNFGQNNFMLKPYIITQNKLSTTVHANSALEALIDYSLFLKKNGQIKFHLEVLNKDGKLASYVLS